MFQKINSLSTVNFKDWSPENIATLLLGIAFGWHLNATPVEDPEEVEGPPEPLVDEPDPNDLIVYREFTNKDKEQEYFVLVEQGGPTIDERGLPTWKPNVWAKLTDLTDDIGNCFGTCSGDNPVIYDLPTQASYDRSACGFLPEDVEDLPDRDMPDHATWKHSGQSAKRRERNLHNWLRWAKKREGNSYILKQGLNAFWKKYFARKNAGTKHTWLTNKQVSCIKGYFEQMIEEGSDG